MKILPGRPGARRLLLAATAAAALAGPAAAQRCTTPEPKSGGRENLGRCVNTRHSERAPVISPDGRSLYFLRDDHPETAGGQDIWVATRQADGSWGTARNVGRPINTPQHNWVVSVLPDDNSLIVANLYDGGTSRDGGISLTYRTREGWSQPEGLVIRDYHTRGNGATFAVSADRRVLVSALDRAGTHGGWDLYVSFAQDDGTWSAPRNMGPLVNSAHMEFGAFVAADGVTMYYTSRDRPGGLGNADMYMVRRLDDSWTRWTQPVNMGPTINTPGFDAGLVLDAVGEYGYLGSDVDSYGSSDIVRVRIPEALRPRPVVLVRGRVLDARTQQPLGAEVFYEGLGNDQRGIARSNPATGEYQIVLPAGARFGFRGQAARYYPESVNVDLSGVTAYAERTQDLRLVPLGVGSTVRLNNIFFATGQAALRPESALELDRLAAYLQANPTAHIEVGGHTDDVGADAANQTLSQARARAVAAYLTGKGIPAARVQSRGYGETRPGDTNGTEEGRQQNRRVEFKVIRL